jgi:hypothetical protein
LIFSKSTSKSTTSLLFGHPVAFVISTGVKADGICYRRELRVGCGRQHRSSLPIQTKLRQVEKKIDGTDLYANEIRYQVGAINLGHQLGFAKSRNRTMLVRNIKQRVTTYLSSNIPPKNFT